MSLTDQQISYFKTFGFLKFPGLFAKEVNLIDNAFEQIYANVVAEDPSKKHDDKRRSELGADFVGQSEYLTSLIGDPRVGGIAGSVLGDDCNYASGVGTHYVGLTAWHSDRCDEGWGPDKIDEAWFPGRCGGKPHLTVNIAFHLDPLTRDTGCLRVIPGSYNSGDQYSESVHKVSAKSAYVDNSQELWGIDGNEVPAFPLEVEPGDVLMFDMRIKHASFGGSTRRRGIMYFFEERYEEADLPVLREFMETHNEERYGERILETIDSAGMHYLEQKLAVAETIRNSAGDVDTS